MDVKKGDFAAHHLERLPVLYTVLWKGPDFWGHMCKVWRLDTVAWADFDGLVPPYYEEVEEQ